MNKEVIYLCIRCLYYPHTLMLSYHCPSFYPFTFHHVTRMLGALTIYFSSIHQRPLTIIHITCPKKQNTKRFHFYRWVFHFCYAKIITSMNLVFNPKRDKYLNDTKNRNPSPGQSRGYTQRMSVERTMNESGVLGQWVHMSYVTYK